MIEADSLFNILDEAWLRKYLREHADRCQMKTWKELQEILKSFMWIASLNDLTGKQFYNLPLFYISHVHYSLMKSLPVFTLS